VAPNEILLSVVISDRSLLAAEGSEYYGDDWTKIRKSELHLIVSTVGNFSAPYFQTMKESPIIACIYNTCTGGTLNLEPRQWMNDEYQVPW